MSDYNPEDFDLQVLLLKSPMLTDVDSSLVEVIKHGLVGYIFDMADPESGVNEEYYYNYLRSRYYSQDDERLVLANEEENIEFVRDELGTFKRALEVVQNKLTELVEFNKDTLSNFYMTTVHDIYPIPFREQKQDYVMLALSIRRQYD